MMCEIHPYRVPWAKALTGRPHLVATSRTMPQRRDAARRPIKSYCQRGATPGDGDVLAVQLSDFAVATPEKMSP